MNTLELKEIERIARRERAEYIARLLAAAFKHVADFGRTVRELAQSVSDARLRHN